MKVIKKILLVKIVSFSFLFATIISCSDNNVKTGMLILEETPVSDRSQENSAGINDNYISGARISGFFPGKPESKKVLTPDFFSAGSPGISFDGKSMLFSAQQKQDDKWQIWEMDLDNFRFRNIISINEDCTDPVYLPDGRIVFSKLTVNDTVKSAHCLFSCNPDGSDLRQITFSPSDNLLTTVLKDGRLLTVSTRLLPEKGYPMLMVLRPDGTKADMFYKGEAYSSILSSAEETSDARLLFIESENNGTQKGRIVSVSYNRPLHSRIDHTTDLDVDFRSVSETGSQKFLVTCRKSISENFSLYEYDPGKNSLVQKIAADQDYDITGALLVENRERPKKLPSEVDMNVKTGLLLCQDINYLDPFLPESLSGKTKAVKIEVLGVDTTYGIVNVEQDGSFQLKVMADKPFRIVTLDEKNNYVNGPGSWLWLRPNERRGCIGCHEDPEMVPRNTVPLAIWKSPVMIPVHITKVNEKTVELE